MNRPDWQIRVIEEQKELNDRLEKLVAFLGTDSFRELDSRSQKLLEGQRSAMFLYNVILCERITWFD